MSKLQEFIGKIVQIIISYNETQTAKNYSLESYINKSHQELNQFLQKIITEATRGYETRKPLLEYFLFVISTIKPLTDQNKSLSEPEQRTIATTLSAFMSTIQILLKTSHSQYISVKYNKEIVQVPGFIRGALKYYSLCNTGQIINRELSESLTQMPFENYFEKLISEHQIPLLEFERLGKAVSEGTTEKEFMQEEIKKLASQNEQQEREIARLTKNNQELADKLERIKTEIELKEKQPRPEVEENNHLRKQLEELKAELLSAKEKSAEDDKTIRHLQDVQNTRTTNVLNNLNDLGIFAIQNTYRNTVRTNNTNNQTTRSEYSPGGKTQTE